MRSAVPLILVSRQRYPSILRAQVSLWAERPPAISGYHRLDGTLDRVTTRDIPQYFDRTVSLATYPPTWIGIQIIRRWRPMAPPLR